MEDMKTPEYTEGPAAMEAFTSAMRHILRVPKEEILRREAAYKAQASMNPRKRGPKPKTRPAASRAPDAGPLA
jgi:hypothetical protein